MSPICIHTGPATFSKLIHLSNLLVFQLKDGDNKAHLLQSLEVLLEIKWRQTPGYAGRRPWLWDGGGGFQAHLGGALIQVELQVCLLHGWRAHCWELRGWEWGEEPERIELWLSWPGAWGAEAIYWPAAARGEAGPGPGLGAGDQGPGRGPRLVPHVYAPTDGWREQMMNQGMGCRTPHPAHKSLTLLGREDCSHLSAITELGPQLRGNAACQSGEFLPPANAAFAFCRRKGFSVVVQSLSRVRPFGRPWTTARQASLSFAISQSLLKRMSIESVMPSNHLILCLPHFFSNPQSFLASRSFPMSQFFASGGQSIGASALVFPWNIQSWFPLGLTGLIFLQSKGLADNLLQHHNSKASVLLCSAFFMVQLSHLYVTTGKTVSLTIRTFVSKVMSLLFNTLSRFVIAFLPRSKRLLISWWSPSAVIFGLQC